MADNNTPAPKPQSISREMRADAAAALARLTEGFSGPVLLDERAQRQLLARLQSMASVSFSVEDYKPKPIEVIKQNGIAIIEICGTLTKYQEWYDEWCGFVSARAIEAALERAAEDPSVFAIVLEIDSPGGMVAGTTELAKMIAHVDQNVKPVYAIVSDMCASGGYWLASQCRKRFANDVATVGSIGVYVCWPDLTDYWAEIGVTWNLISTGRYKGLGADYKVTEDLKEQEQREINAIFELFIAAIVSGVGLSDAQVRALADGRCWIGAQAQTNGLIDEIASREAAYQAIYMEVTQMTIDQFRAYAAEHPEAANEFIEKGRKEGHKAGLAEGTTAERNRCVELINVGGNRTQLIVDAINKGTDPEGFKSTVAAIDRETKSANDAVTQATAAKDAEIAELKKKLEANGAAAAGSSGVSTAGAAKRNEQQQQQQAVAGDMTYANAEEQAKDEWANNVGDCKKRFSSEKIYIAFRRNELAGNVKYNSPD